ncbi:ABC transporter permease [bacterium]|nr:ABC transporter permease [bacterium]
MVKYEIKKIFSTLSNKIALGLLAMMVLLSAWMAVSNVEWVNETGDPETGFTAIGKLRSAQKEWSGILDEDRLQQILRENQRIAATPEALSRDYQQNDIAYGWRQGFRPVLDMMNQAYASGFQEFDWYTNERITPDQAGDFYPNRTKLMKQWLYDETGSAYRLFTEKEKLYLVEQYETLDTPFYYTYAEGWEQLLYNSPFVIMVGALILGYLAAGIFANEFKWKSDAVFFSARYGRDKAAGAKIGAGFVMVTALYWSAVLVYTLLTLGCLGFDGWNCPIQIDLWKVFYHLKLWQAWALTAVGGYIGSLFFVFLTMWVSAKTRSSLFAVTVPFLLIFLPSFLDNLNIDKLSKFLGLFPDQLLQIYQALRYFYVYEIGGKVFNAMTLLMVIYSLLTVVLAPMMYRDFRRKEIG